MDLAKLLTGAVGNVVDYLGTAANLPELGLSEALSGGEKTLNTGRYDVNAPKPLDTALNPVTETFYNMATTGSPLSTSQSSQPTYTEDVLGASSTLSPSRASGYSGSAYGGGSSSNLTNEQASYDDTISMLDRLLNYAATKRQQGVQSIEDQIAGSKEAQRKAFEKQRLQNTQAQESGYNEVGNFANTSLNNLNRLLQGANAGRSSVGQVLAPFMVSRAADTRRKAVTDTAGENMQNIQIAEDTANQDIENQRKSKLSEFEQAMLTSQNDLESQKRQAQIARGMASGLGYAQAAQQAQGLTSSMDNRYAQLADIFNKYKPDYSVKEAPALSTYQVDPAKLTQGQTDPTQSSFYLNQLKRKKENGL